MQMQPKVGDEVGYCHRHSSWGTLLRSGFSRVVKINGHGHIHLEDGRVFNKHGEERNVLYGGLRLIDAERLREERRHISEQRARNAAANELRTLLDRQRNGRGEQCPASDETRARMIELINKL